MKRIADFIRRYAVTALIFVGLFALYAYMTSHGLADPVLFPTLDQIGASFVDNASVMPKNLASSFALMVPAFLIGTVIALGLGILMGLNKPFRQALYPVVYAISVVPSILLSPFALHVAPTFAAASIFLIVYNTIWATLFATITGIMTIDKRYLENADVLQIKGPKKLVQVILPAAMPSIMSGIVTSLRSSFLVLSFAEMYGMQYGMGYFVKKNADFGLFNNVWSGFLFMIVVLVIVMQIFEKLKNHVLRWTM